MINYFENPKKYNKILWKFMYDNAPDKSKTTEKMPEAFVPEAIISGACYLDWIAQDIMESSTGGHEYEIITSRRQTSARVIIRDWYDVSNPKGFVVIVNIEGDKYPAVLYNACISFILRTK